MTNILDQKNYTMLLGMIAILFQVSCVEIMTKRHASLEKYALIILSLNFQSSILFTSGRLIHHLLNVLQDENLISKLISREETLHQQIPKTVRQEKIPVL